MSTISLLTKASAAEGIVSAFGAPAANVQYYLMILKENGRLNITRRRKRRTAMIQLTTPRLSIRDHRPTDLVAYHELLSNPKVMFRHSQTSQNLDQSKERLRQAIEQIDLPQRKLYFFCIEDRFTFNYIGEIGYTVTEFTPLGKLAGAGYFIHDAYWGGGYTTEALREVIRFAFEENDVYRIAAGCLKENIASERVMQKCGFFKEADFKEYQWHDGQLKDRVEYRLLRSEWLQTI